MTSVTSNENNKTSIVKQKLQGNKASSEETCSFLKISRENLSISQSDLEQNFNKPRFQTKKHLVLSTLAFLLAIASITVEIWKFHGVMENAKEIEILKKDVETLKHRFLEEDLLKAFEEQLYAKDESDNSDLGDDEIDEDYDSNYEDDLTASQGYSGDYQNYSGYEAVEDSVTPTVESNKDLKEMLTALHKVEVEKSNHENHKNIEHERILAKNKEHKKRQLKPYEKMEDSIHVTRKRSVDNKETNVYVQNKHFIHTSPYSHNHSRLDHAFPTAIDENKAEAIASRESHPPKKYVLQSIQEPHSVFSTLFSEVTENSNSKINSDEKQIIIQNSSRKRFLPRNAFKNIANVEKIKGIENTESAMRLSQRKMVVRHLRVPRQMYAVNYGADMNLFSNDDEHTGNGRAKHSAGIFKAWQPSDWVQELGMNRHFTLSSDGRLTVHEPGLYLLYAQIHYLDEHDENGFHVLVNGVPILQCMVYSPGTGHKSRSCFSAQVTVLKGGDHVVLKDVGSARYTLFQKDKSFFGLVKLGDWRQSQRHQTQQPSSQK